MTDDQLRTISAMADIAKALGILTTGNIDSQARAEKAITRLRSAIEQLDMVGMDVQDW